MKMMKQIKLAALISAAIAFPSLANASDRGNPPQGETNAPNEEFRYPLRRYICYAKPVRGAGHFSGFAADLSTARARALEKCRAGTYYVQPCRPAGCRRSPY